MAVEDLDKVDMEVGYKNGDLRMVIIDGLPWGDDEAITHHLNTLLRKINLYLNGADSDAYRQKYPGLTLEKLTIEIVLRYPPPAGVEEFLEEHAARLAAEGVKLVYGVRE